MAGLVGNGDEVVKRGPALIPLGTHEGKGAIPIHRPAMVIGARQNAHLRLHSHQVSRAHALLVCSNGGVYLCDLVSRNHIYINGRMVREANLRNGDLIGIGGFTFELTGLDTHEQASDSEEAEAGALEVDETGQRANISHRVVVIGRRGTCDIALSDQGVSTTHAVVFEINGQRFIRDLGSRTGTYVNGDPIHQTQINFGDVIRIGQNSLRYVPNLDGAEALTGGCSTLIEDETIGFDQEEDKWSDNSAAERDEALEMPIATQEQAVGSAGKMLHSDQSWGSLNYPEKPLSENQKVADQVEPSITSVVGQIGEEAMQPSAQTNSDRSHEVGIVPSAGTFQIKIPPSQEKDPATHGPLPGEAIPQFMAGANQVSFIGGLPLALEEPPVVPKEFGRVSVSFDRDQAKPSKPGWMEEMYKERGAEQPQDKQLPEKGVAFPIQGAVEVISPDSQEDLDAGMTAPAGDISSLSPEDIEDAQPASKPKTPPAIRRISLRSRPAAADVEERGNIGQELIADLESRIPSRETGLSEGRRGFEGLAMPAPWEEDVFALQERFVGSEPDVFGGTGTVARNQPEAKIPNIDYGGEYQSIFPEDREDIDQLDDLETEGEDVKKKPELKEEDETEEDAEVAIDEEEEEYEDEEEYEEDYEEMYVPAPIMALPPQLPPKLPVMTRPVAPVVFDKSRRVAVMVILILMLICTAVTTLTIYTKLAPASVVEGSLVFKNYHDLPVNQRKEVELEQTGIWESETLRNVARGMLHDNYKAAITPGFLTDQALMYGEPHLFWEPAGRKDTLVFRYRSTEPITDQARVQAVMAALYKLNTRKVELAADTRQEIDNLTQVREGWQRKIDQLKAKINQPASTTAPADAKGTSTAEMTDELAGLQQKLQEAEVALARKQSQFRKMIDLQTPQEQDVQVVSEKDSRLSYIMMSMLAIMTVFGSSMWFVSRGERIPLQPRKAKRRKK